MNCQAKSPLQCASVRGDLLFLKDVGNLTEWAEDRAMKFYTPQTPRQASVRWACLCGVISSSLMFLDVLSVYCRCAKVAESTAHSAAHWLLLSDSVAVHPL